MKIFFPVAQWKNDLYFGAKSNRQYQRLTEKNYAHARYASIINIEMGLSHRMHQTSNNR